MYELLRTDCKLNIKYNFVDADDPYALRSVDIVPTSSSNTQTVNPSVRVTVTDSYSDDEEEVSEMSLSKWKPRLPSIFKPHSADDVIELETGERLADEPHALDDAVTHFNESYYNISLTKTKLKPKLPQASASLPVRSQHDSNERSATLGGSDVILSLGDLELESMDEDSAMQQDCKLRYDEHIV